MQYSDLIVIHEPENSRFVVYFPGEKEVAETRYFMEDEQSLNFTHTYVPPSYGGKGVGGRIIRSALAYAKAHGFKIVPSCPTWRLFFGRHPEFRELVKGGW